MTGSLAYIGHGARRPLARGHVVAIKLDPVPGPITAALPNARMNLLASLGARLAKAAFVKRKTRNGILCTLRTIERYKTSGSFTLPE